MRSLKAELIRLIDLGSQQVIGAVHRAEAASLHDQDLNEVLRIVRMRRIQIDAIVDAVASGRGVGPWDLSLSEAEAALSGDNAVDRFGRPDPMPSQEELHGRRYLDLTRLPDGGYALVGYLDPVHGAVVKQALDGILGR